MKPSETTNPLSARRLAKTSTKEILNQIKEDNAKFENDLLKEELKKIRHLFLTYANQNGELEEDQFIAGFGPLLMNSNNYTDVFFSFFSQICCKNLKLISKKNPK